MEATMIEEVETEPELSAEEEAQRVKTIIEEGFKNFNSGNHFTYKTVGAALVELRDKSLYQQLGYKTVDDALREMGKSRSICYAMMDYHEVITPLVEKHPELQNINVTSLCKHIIPAYRQLESEIARGLKMAQAMVDFEDCLVSIAAMCDADQKDEIRRIRGKRTQVDCAHEHTEAWARCKDCGKFIKVR